MNGRVKISSKGQLVLPKAVRDQFGLIAGSEVNIDSTDSSIVLTPLRRNVRKKYTVDEVAGMLKYDGPPVSVRDMDRAVEEEFRRQWHAKGA